MPRKDTTKRKAYAKQWYEDNKEKIKTRDAEYYENNKEKIKARNKKYYKDNIKEMRLRSRTHHQKNKEEINSKRKGCEKTKVWRKEYDKLPESKISRNRHAKTYWKKNKEEINFKRREQRKDPKIKKQLSIYSKENYNKNRTKLLKQKKIKYQQTKEFIYGTPGSFEKDIKKRMYNILFLSDSYVIGLICQKNSLEKEDIPEKFIEFYRTRLILKRTLEEKKDDKN